MNKKYKIGVMRKSSIYPGRAEVRKAQAISASSLVDALFKAKLQCPAAAKPDSKYDVWAVPVKEEQKHPWRKKGHL